MLLYPSHHGCDRGQLDLVIHRLRVLLVHLHRATTMWASLGLGKHDVVRVGCSGPPPPARPTLASRRVLIRGPGRRFASGYVREAHSNCGHPCAARALWLRAPSSRACRRCTSAHSAAMSASFSGSDKRSSSGSLFMAALSGPYGQRSRDSLRGLNQLQKYHGNQHRHQIGCVHWKQKPVARLFGSPAPCVTATRASEPTTPILGLGKKRSYSTHADKSGASIVGVER